MQQYIIRGTVSRMVLTHNGGWSWKEADWRVFESYSAASAVFQGLTLPEKLVSTIEPYTPNSNGHRVSPPVN